MKMIEQYSKEWYLRRLGKFTGSQIGDLMVKGRKKDELFGATAMTYIYGVAAERDLATSYKIDDYLWEIYQNQVSVSTKYTEWGHDNEELAIEKYEDVTHNRCDEVGSVVHPTLPTFAASPDRIANVNGEATVVEVKCPLPKTFMKYKVEIKDNQSLLAVEPKYYYQVQAEMLCTGCKQADFVVFCPFQSHPIHIVRILADEDVQKELETRVIEAEKLIESWISRKKD